jgi:hypothetical protein
MDMAERSICLQSQNPLLLANNAAPGYQHEYLIRVAAQTAV